MRAEHNKYCAAAWFTRNTAAQLQPLKQISVSPSGLEEMENFSGLCVRFPIREKQDFPQFFFIQQSKISLQMAKIPRNEAPWIPHFFRSLSDNHRIQCQERKMLLKLNFFVTHEVVPFLGKVLLLICWITIRDQQKWKCACGRVVATASVSEYEFNSSCNTKTWLCAMKWVGLLFVMAAL